MSSCELPLGSQVDNYSADPEIIINNQRHYKDLLRVYTSLVPTGVAVIVLCGITVPHAMSSSTQSQIHAQHAIYTTLPICPVHPSSLSCIYFLLLLLQLPLFILRCFYLWSYRHLQRRFRQQSLSISHPSIIYPMCYLSCKSQIFYTYYFQLGCFSSSL